MAAVQLLDSAGQPVPRFARFLATKIPSAFARGSRALITAACEQGYSEAPPRHDNDLPYWKNIQPHIRNSFACERLHRLAEECGMVATVRELDNHYFYLEIESSGLVLHVKHKNNYQTLFEQITKADYRRQMADTLNSGWGQLGLELAGAQMRLPDRAYAIMFYEDGANKSTAGDIYFILPSQNEDNMPTASLEEVIAAYSPPDEGTQPRQDDQIDLPPKDGGKGNQKTK